MTIAVLADEGLKKEWLRKGVQEGVEVLWCGSVKTLIATVADVYIDLLYEPDKERSKQLAMRSDYPFFINSVEYTLQQAGNNFIRINAWPGFLGRDIIEVAIAEPEQESIVKRVFEKLNWKYRIIPDVPGMITARIIASIINEAYYTYGEGISGKDEIDIAMKLGTSYPMGPFEWSEEIGLEKIASLLTELGKTDQRYQLAPAMEKEVNQIRSGK
jgi:3-hydroxybutyryl-CoA dehydrogenase